MLEDSHGVHYSYDSTPTVMVLGIGDIFITLITLLQNGLIVAQGFLGVKAVKKDKASEVELLIRNALILTLAHLALTSIQILIATIYISDNEDSWSNLNKDNNTYSKKELIDITYGIIFATFFFGCICTCCQIEN